MAIHINQPYKILPLRYKRYTDHYMIPADKALVVPQRSLGDEVSCDVRWEDENGELQIITNVVFVNANLLPINPLLEVKMYELWQHYYGETVDHGK